MDGLLIIDKPAGPTSHDVVARVRRALKERHVGHTGTLDPAATGVLALVLGRATRLAQFLSRTDKSYEAVVRLGFSTDTGDAQGRPTTAAIDMPIPDREAIETALNAFRGTFLQQPPAFSAKKIDGKRSHKLARAHGRNGSGDGDNSVPAPSPPPLPAPATVTVHKMAIIALDGDRLTLTIDSSAGFYVRSLAHDLGKRLGVGGHLVALRRVRSGDFSLADAVNLEMVERQPALAVARVVPLASMLPGITPVVLTPSGVRKARNGVQLGPLDCASGFELRDPLYRLFDEAGALIAIARPSSGPAALHPSVVLV